RCLQASGTASSLSSAISMTLLASQRQMLINRGEPVDDSPGRRARLKTEYARVLQAVKTLLRSRDDIATLYLDRRAILSDPRAAARSLSDFLGGLDADRMSAAVRPELDRRRG